jgi:hypothetical protein
MIPKHADFEVINLGGLSCGLRSDYAAEIYPTTGSLELRQLFLIARASKYCLWHYLVLELFVSNIQRHSLQQPCSVLICPWMQDVSKRSEQLRSWRVEGSVLAFGDQWFCAKPNNDAILTLRVSLYVVFVAFQKQCSPVKSCWSNTLKRFELVKVVIRK